VNRVLRRIRGPKGGDERMEEAALTSRIRIIESRRMKWAEHVTLMGKRKVYKLLVGNPEEK
jgi:hypothetical protein